MLSIMLDRTEPDARWGQRRLAARGFTLVELVVCMAIMMVLMTVVLIGKGFLDDSREDQTVTTVLALQSAAVVWSERTNHGWGYSSVDEPGLVDISLESMCEAGVLTAPGSVSDCENHVKTAWKGSIWIKPYQKNGIDPTKRVEITFCAPDAIHAKNMVEKLTKANRFDDHPDIANDLGCSGTGVRVFGK